MSVFQRQSSKKQRPNPREYVNGRINSLCGTSHQPVWCPPHGPTLLVLGPPKGRAETTRGKRRPRRARWEVCRFEREV